MLEERLELSWGRPRWILNPVRLPISPLQQKEAVTAEYENAVGAIIEVIQVLAERSSAAGTPKRYGAEEDRTPDLYNAIVALSQLSYGPVISLQNITQYITQVLACQFIKPHIFAAEAYFY